MLVMATGKDGAAPHLVVFMTVGVMPSPVFMQSGGKARNGPVFVGG